MVKLLFLKMLRDMKRSLVTYLLCGLVVTIGFCGYAVLELASRNLIESRDAFFETTSFCDGFAEVEAAPGSIVKNLAAIPGIEEVEGRLVERVLLSGVESAKSEEDVQLQIVSIQQGGMNIPLLSRGVLPQGRELVIGDGIAEARQIKTGDRVWIVVAGKRVELDVSGSGLTPENIYMIKDIGDMFPDPAAYGAGFMDYEAMAAMFSKPGQVNSFLFRLEPGVRWKEVKEPIEELLKPYGCRKAYDNGDQLSVNMLNEELMQLERMTGVIPFLFLSVAAVILYITLSRLVEQQRTQVGTLMALGIPAKKVQIHYTAYGAFTGMVGGILGGGSGYLLADPMANFYREYFSLPAATAPVSWQYMINGIVIATVFCGGTAWLIAGALGRLSPAEALRPAAPKAAKPFFLEHIPGFVSLFTVPGMMALRSLTRNKRRAVISLTGIAFAYMITAALVSLNNMFDVFIFDSWEKNQRQDMMVQFNQPVAARDALEAVRHSEVQYAEGVLDLSAELKGPAGTLDSTIQALEEDSVLLRLFREDGSRAHVEHEGIILSRHMADVLGVHPGSSITVKVSYPQERISTVLVTDIVAQYMGSTAYMSHYGAGQISEYRQVYTSVLLKAPDYVRAEILNRLDDATAVSLVESRQGRLAKYRTMVGSMSGIMSMMSMLGVLIGFVVIYISSLISFEELKREISTLMVLGLKSKQCLDVISVGQWILACGGIILGLPMARGISYLMSETMSSELYSIPNFIEPRTLLLAVGLTFLSVIFSSQMMLRKIKRISPVDLLRERE